MNLVLVIRAEIICLIILVFIMLYSSLYKMGKDHWNFLRICIFAIGHVVFDIITVLTVNNLNTVPPFVNRLSHIIFYMFALLYSYEFLCYIISLSYSKKVLKKSRIIFSIPLIAYTVTVPFLRMEYLSGRGTNYSFGPAAIVGYGVAMVLFISSIFIVLKNRKKMDKHAVSALLPMLFAAIAFEVIQIAVPEMLFTGGAVTIITVGFFFSLENPMAVLSQKVFTDAMTGVKSRHSYEADIVTMEREYEAGAQYGIVFCDINDLKAVNNLKGHLEGDSYIGCIAQILLNCMKSADTIYRMGGDEFLAVYSGKNISRIDDEIASVESDCEEQSLHRDYSVGLAIGYAVSGKDYKHLRDVLRMADFRMYSHKAEIKQQRAYMLSGSENLNITGLTDRIFEAFASTDSDRFLFVCNMSTNVTRWSHSAVEYFGMKSEFSSDFNKSLLERIHPDDKDSFFDDVSAVFSGSQKCHDLEFRIKNSVGEYAICSSTGTVLHGKNGDPDLFAGTMLIRSAADSIDKLTNLRNGYEMMNYFNYLIRNNIQAALIKLSILNLSRINMLYGHICGNEIIKQFSAELRSIVGGSGSVFRSNGTKFVICIPGATEENLKETYRKIQASAEHRIHLDTLTPPLQLAAGAYMLDENFDGTNSFLRSNLIFAHDQSKYEERGRLIFYIGRNIASGSNDHKNQLLNIHQDAIAGREGFYLVYQSVVSAETGKIIGAEALLRWSDKTFGNVGPESFIPWLEEDPCFFGLGNWILKRALTDAKSILTYLPDFTINVNIAMSQLEHEGFRGAVLDIISETGFPASQLCLELTERCRELNATFLKGEIEFFRSHGIHVVLDDLGTGFSSFGLLLSLNVDGIKLDRAFVKEIRTQRVNQILTKLLIDASKNMGYFTCLEGVSDKEIQEYLCSYGATYYQGYYCDTPSRLDEFVSHLKKWNSEKA